MHYGKQAFRLVTTAITNASVPKGNEDSQPPPALVLGIDAAWTAHNPSGVALVQRAAEGWQCMALAPSYDAFLALAAGQPWDKSLKT